MDVSTRINTKAVQNEALKILFAQLNPMITAMQPTWTAEEDQLWAALGRGNPDWTVETIANANFHPGTIQPHLQRPVTEYPNVCTIAYDARPKNSSDDWGENYTVIFAVEVMVKSLESEEEVNTRIQNTLDACHLVFMDKPENRTLNNLVPALQPPRQTIGDVFVGRAERGLDSSGIWFWQGGRLEYTIDKYVSF